MGLGQSKHKFPPSLPAQPSDNISNMINHPHNKQEHFALVGKERTAQKWLILSPLDWTGLDWTAISEKSVNQVLAVFT